MAMLRVASFQVVPCAFRAVASPRILSPRLTNSLVSVAKPAPLSRRFHCKAHASDKVVKALDSEIKLRNSIKRRPVPPPNFAFKVDQSGYGGASHVFISRELDGEEIDIRVLDPIESADNHNDDVDGGTTTTDSDDTCSDSDSCSDSDNTSDSYSDSTEEEEDEQQEKKQQSPVESVPLKIEITKQNGQSLKFAAVVSAEKVLVERLTTKEGDKVICAQLYIQPDSELQKALTKFLEVRGVDKSMAGFLFEQMVWNKTIPSRMHSRSIEEKLSPEDEEHLEKLYKLKEIILAWST